MTVGERESREAFLKGIYQKCISEIHVWAQDVQNCMIQFLYRQFLYRQFLYRQFLYTYGLCQLILYL